MPGCDPDPVASDTTVKSDTSTARTLDHRYAAAVASEFDTNNRSSTGTWVFHHAGLVAAVLLPLFVVTRVLAISNFSTETAFVILSTLSATDVISGTLASFYPTMLLSLVYVSGWILYVRKGTSATRAVAGASFTFCLVMMLFTQPWVTNVLVWIAATPTVLRLILTRWPWARRKLEVFTEWIENRHAERIARRLPRTPAADGLPAPAELDRRVAELRAAVADATGPVTRHIALQELNEYLAAIRASVIEAKGEIGQLKAFAERVRAKADRIGRIEVALPSVPLFVPWFYGTFAFVYALSAPVGLPGEQIQLDDGSTVVGYELDSSATDMVFLRDDSRSVMRIGVSTIEDRTYCVVSDQRGPAVDLRSSNMYGQCDG